MTKPAANPALPTCRKSYDLLNSDWFGSNLIVYVFCMPLTLKSVIVIGLLFIGDAASETSSSTSLMSVLLFCRFKERRERWLVSWEPPAWRMFWSRNFSMLVWLRAVGRFICDYIGTIRIVDVDERLAAILLWPSILVSLFGSRSLDTPASVFSALFEDWCLFFLIKSYSTMR